MRKVNRGKQSGPAVLDKKYSDDKSELERVRDHLNNPQTQNKAYAFERYKELEVKMRLEEIFHGKCAYCETYYAADAPVDVEHFRPKGRVAEDANHSGYWWLAMVWENLLPSCIDCNRRRGQIIIDHAVDLSTMVSDSKKLGGHGGKQDSFPVKGTRAVAEESSFESEEAYLLNPCNDDPAHHLEFYFDGITQHGPVGLVLPKNNSEKGRVSIQTYGLNRLGLVQNRTRILRHLEFLATVYAELDAILHKIDTAEITPSLKNDIEQSIGQLQGRILDEMKRMTDPKEPYSAMTTEWVRQFRDWILK